MVALAAFPKRFLPLLVKVLMGIAVPDVQWVSRAIAGLLGMWDSHRGSSRGADGSVEAVFSVLEKQGGGAAGDTTNRRISAHMSVQAGASRAALLSSPADRLCSEAGLVALLHQPCSMLGCSQDSRVHWNGYTSTYGCLLLHPTEEGRAAGDFNGVCNLILDVMGSFCTTDLKVTLYPC